MNWFLFWLFLHILAAVIAFGPLFVFPIVGTMAAQAPQNMRFATELNHRISTSPCRPAGADDAGQRLRFDLDR